MKRSFLVAGAACLASATAPVAASAQTVELGVTKSPLVSPVCPPNVSQNNCTIILTRATALETIRDGTDYPTTASKSGELVAVTLGLSQLSTTPATAHSIVSRLDTLYGGTTQAAVAVLKPVGSHKNFQWQLVATSPVFHLQPYLGSITQFPLSTPLPIAAGDTVALSVPTWAPVLSISLTKTDFAYRQSRTSNCPNAATTNQAMFTLSVTDVFGCDYTGTRVEYTATEITNPTPSKIQIHSVRRRALRPKVLSRVS